MKKYAIIVAGGKGLRFGANLPKQFLLLKGLPIIMHSINRFKSFDKSIEIILVLPNEHMSYWKEICDEYDFKTSHSIAQGGETRFHSVKNGLSLVTENSLVAIHDGVRPLVSIDTIKNAFEMADKEGAAIPVVELVDSIREMKGTESKPLLRENYRLVQTPQVFKSDILAEAYKQPYNTEFTDDASVVERAGYKVRLVKGNIENIKITNQIDLQVAEGLI
jgi:2-C-methyl-D-erythritol 4-phosphate cytidylyltransferase